MINTLLIATFVVMAIGCGYQWQRGFSRKRKGQSILLERDVDPTPLGLIDVAVMFGFWIFGQIGALLIAATMISVPLEELDSATSSDMAILMLVVGVVQLLMTFLAIAVYVVRYGSSACVGWQKAFFRADVQLGFIGFLLIVPITQLIQLGVTQIWPYEHPTLEMLSEDQSGLSLASAWLLAFIVAPITEEIFFRGVLQNWLQRFFIDSEPIEPKLIGGYMKPAVDSGEPAATESFSLTGPSGESTESDGDVPAASLARQNESLDETGNPYQPSVSATTTEAASNGSDMPTGMNYWWPIVITSVLFAIVHLGQGPAPIPLFFFALGLGWVFRQTNSLWACIVMHMMLNGFSLFWMTLGLMFPESVTPPVELAPGGP